MKRLLATCVIAILAAACGGESAAGGPQPTGAARSGEELFMERILGPNPGCISCHSLDPDTTLVGPSIAGVAARAATRIAGQSAPEYLRASILDPSAYVVEGFADGTMPSDWDEVLTTAEVDELVAYLLTRD